MGGMGELGETTGRQTDEQLAEQEASLLLSTRVDLQALRPQVSDAAAYEKLIQAVGAATAMNESVAAFRKRVEDLGAGVVKVAREVAVLL